MYDILIRNKLIIEFNGDFWHANPSIYKSNWIHPLLKESAKNIWNKHKIKINLSKNLGYENLIVWEKDFNANQKEIIKNIIKIINNVNQKE
jgi:hypothetical protein